MSRSPTRRPKRSPLGPRLERASHQVVANQLLHEIERHGVSFNSFPLDTGYEFVDLGQALHEPSGEARGFGSVNHSMVEAYDERQHQTRHRLVIIEISADDRAQARRRQTENRDL